MKSKEFSTKVTAACIVAFILLVIAIKCGAQTVEHRKGTRKIGWNNAKFFEEKPKLKLLDWSSYGETWDLKQFTIWSMMAGAGVSRGIAEKYHADPYIFEKRNGVNSNSFWGSDSPKRNYNPDGSHKTQIIGNFGRDVYHTSLDVSIGFIAISTLSIGFRKHPRKFKLANFLIAMAIQSGAQALTYEIVR